MFLQLLLANIGRTIAIMAVSNILIVLCKVAVAGITAGIALGILPKIYSKLENLFNFLSLCLSDITSGLPAAILVFIGAYIICSVFMVVFSSMIDTIFLCFLIDEDVNKKAGKPVFIMLFIMYSEFFQYELIILFCFIYVSAFGSQIFIHNLWLTNSMFQLMAHKTLAELVDDPHFKQEAESHHNEYQVCSHTRSLLKVCSFFRSVMIECIKSWKASRKRMLKLELKKASN